MSRVCVPRGLVSLASEARKYGSFDEFSDAFSLGCMRGQYWHVTDDPGFSIREVSPRDLSSMAGGFDGGNVGLMVSCDPALWSSYFPGRGYAAEIDLSRAVPDRDYRVVDRGFGHEVFVRNLGAVSLKRVVPLSTAIRSARYYNEVVVPQSREELFEFWSRARSCGVG